MNNLSIRQKIIFVVTFFVVFTAVSIGALSLITAKSTIEARLLESELPTTISAIAKQIDDDIVKMQDIAQSIATDPFLLQWLEQGSKKSDEPLVVRKLKQIARHNKLSSTSFADKQTANYWNQDGFLRQLQPGPADGWFFDYIESDNTTMSSVYREPDTGKVDLYVNYQQSNGRGLSGTSKSFQAVVDMLASFTLEESGLVFLTNDAGVIQLHPNSDQISQNLNQDVEGFAVSSLFSERTFNYSVANVNGQETLFGAAYIPSLDWYLVAQVPYDEMFSGLSFLIWEILIYALLIVSASIIATLLIAKSILKPINELEIVFTKLGDGRADLSFRLPESGQLEFNTVAKGYNRFVDKLEAMIDDIASTSDVLKSIAKELESDAVSTMQRADNNASHTNEVSDTITQISETSKLASENAKQAAEVSASLNENGKVVSSSILTSQQDVLALASKVKDVTNVINTLTENTDTIANVLTVIEGISEQTNLLALNAAIEAARAGEQGRGFAVVADEVRSLAGRTAESTKEVQRIMEMLKHSSSAATTEIDSIMRQSQSTADTIVEAEKILSKNSSQFSIISEANNVIFSTAQQQFSNIASVKDSMSMIKNNATENLNKLQKIANQTEELNRLSERLATMVFNTHG